MRLYETAQQNDDLQGLDRVTVLGVPQDLQTGDYLAGMEVLRFTVSQHNDRPAIQFTLRSSSGECGRIAVQLDTEIVFTRHFPNSQAREDFLAEIESPPPIGYRWSESRLLLVGQTVRVPDSPGWYRDEVLTKVWIEADSQGFAWVAATTKSGESIQFGVETPVAVKL
jgi:hypothetical protein